MYEKGLSGILSIFWLFRQINIAQYDRINENIEFLQLT